MMRPVTKSLEIKVGLLVVLGLAATVATILLSDRIELDQSYRVAVYLSDAGGLRSESPATLAGIRIGEVDSIKPVSDARGQIRAVVKIKNKYELPADCRVQLSTAGIFGDAFLAFSAASAHQPGAKTLPADGSAELTAAPSFFDEATSQAQRIMVGVNEVLAPETRQDLRRLAKNAADLAGESAKLAKNLNDQAKLLSETLEAVKHATTTLDATTKRLGERLDTVADKSIQALDAATTAITAIGSGATRTTTAAEGAIKRLDGLLAKVEASPGTSDLAATMKSVRELSERLARIAAAIDEGKGMLGQLVSNRDLARDLHRLALDAGSAAKNLADQPSNAVWGLSDREARADREARQREMQRRALEQGFPATEPKPDKKP